MKKIWIIDLLAAVGFGLAFLPKITGFDLHEWIGIVVGVVLIVHLIQHWQWVVKVTKKFHHLTNLRVKVNYVLDGMIAAIILSMILTGLVISSLLMLPLLHYETWCVIHVVSSYAGLVLVAVKLALHWDWIVLTIRKGFKISRANAPKQPLMDRRHFLRGAVVGVAATAVALFEFNQWNQRMVSANIVPENIDALPQTEGAAEIMADSSKDQASSFNKPLSEDVENDETAEQNEKLATSAPAEESTATPEPTFTVAVDEPVETGKVLCNKGCSYPGKCRRYQDDNENGKCDLGEPIW